MTQHQQTPWGWHQKDERSERNGSIYSMRHPGHAYAVAMQPRYVESDQWAEDAALIVKAVNERPALVKALKDLSDMYTVAWDRVDGCLVMFGGGLERFEKAHHAAQVALHIAIGSPLPISDDEKTADPGAEVTSAERK